jgi:hypothetical protein
MLCTPLCFSAGFELPREGFIHSNSHFTLNSKPARHVFREIPKPVKIAQIDPNFLQHPPATTSNSLAKFHNYSISQTRLFPHFPFIAILFESSAKNSFSPQNFKPSTHFTPIHSYIPIREVSAQFQVITCLISNFKLSMAQFTVQTLFSRHLTSVYPNHSVLCHNSLCMYLFTFHILMTM